MKCVNAVTIKELYDLSHTEAKPLMESYTYPWEVLPHIGSRPTGSTICPD